MANLNVFQPTFFGIIIRAFFNTQTLKEISKITFGLRYFLVSVFFVVLQNNIYLRTPMDKIFFIFFPIGGWWDYKKGGVQRHP